MRETRTDIMGMPITIEIIDGDAAPSLTAAFDYLRLVDEQFSPYKETSEVSRINSGELEFDHTSLEMKEVLALGERTRNETEGYFDMHRPDGTFDPSGVVKGWAIARTAALLRARGHEHFMVEAAGDIALAGKNSQGEEWSIGIRNPFAYEEVVKVIYPKGSGIATSGSAARGAHIYNPHSPNESLDEIVSITVIGPDVLEADRFATAAFAMGRVGIEFIERTAGLEGYAIDKDGIATMTSGFLSYV